MTRLKKLAIAMTVAVGSLIVVPTASAMPIDACLTAAHMRHVYQVTGWAFASIGNFDAANYWYAKADFYDAFVVASCGFGIG